MVILAGSSAHFLEVTRRATRWPPISRIACWRIRYLWALEESSVQRQSCFQTNVWETNMKWQCHLPLPRSSPCECYVGSRWASDWSQQVADAPESCDAEVFGDGQSVESVVVSRALGAVVCCA